MLKVRGDSMIDAGILDGDYVVVRQQPRGGQRRDRGVAGIPGGGGHRQDLQPQGHQDRAPPGQPSPGAPCPFDTAEVTIFGKVVTVLRRLMAPRPAGLRDRAGALALGLGLRLRLGAGPRPPFGAGTWTWGPARSGPPRYAVDRLQLRAVEPAPRAVRHGGVSPGPKLVAGIPCSEKKATSVHPSFASGGQPDAATSRASNGSSRPGRADGARSRTSMRSPRSGSSDGPSRCSMAATASSALRSGAKRWLRVTVAESGTTLPATPPRTPTACNASRYWHPSITGWRPV